MTSRGRWAAAAAWRRGDMICTGAMGLGPLAVGDVVEVDIPGIGVLRNPVVAP